MVRILAALVLLLAGAARGAWEFAPPIEVVPGTSAFVPVESAGRKNVAVSGARAGGGLGPRDRGHVCRPRPFK